MGEKRTLKTVERIKKADIEKFHHGNRLLLDEVDSMLIKIRVIEDEKLRRDWNGIKTVEREEGQGRSEERPHHG